MNECMKILLNRRSVKSYKKDAVPHELLEKITEAELRGLENIWPQIKPAVTAE